MQVSSPVLREVRVYPTITTMKLRSVGHLGGAHLFVRGLRDEFEFEGVLGEEFDGLESCGCVGLGFVAGLEEDGRVGAKG